MLRASRGATPSRESNQSAELLEQIPELTKYAKLGKDEFALAPSFNMTPAIVACTLSAERGSQPEAGLGGEMKKLLAHRVTVPPTGIPSPAGEAVAAIQDLRELDAAEARDGAERSRLHLDHDARQPLEGDFFFDQRLGNNSYDFAAGTLSGMCQFRSSNQRWLRHTQGRYL